LQSSSHNKKEDNLIASTEIGNCTVRDTDENPMLLLQGQDGGYVFLSAGQVMSKYQGVHFKVQDQLYKTIETIRPVGTEVTELKNKLYSYERLGQNFKETLFTNQNGALLYGIKGFKGYVELVLDTRKIYDFSTEGRNYSIRWEDNVILIEYTKTEGDQYKIYIAIAGAGDYVVVDDWTEQQYMFDKARGSGPLSMWVYRALRILVDDDARLAFGFSTDGATAKQQAVHALENYEFIKKTRQNLLNTFSNTNIKCSNDEITAAYKCSLNSMETFHGSLGLYAGYPWFTQIWTRDEAISMGCLLAEKHFNFVKELVFKHLQVILDDGRVPNRLPASMLGSADGVGWVFKRTYDFLTKAKLSEYVDARELLYIQRRLALSIQRLVKHHTKDGLAVAADLETWMDTGYKDDTRPGARIEIQALRLSMYKLMRHVSSITGYHVKYNTYSELEATARHKVREVFWKKPVLQDGAEDPTIRPNIFMACYIYPDLLSKREWTACFDHALEKLWLPWGGIATIDKEHKYFIDTYTGQDNRSYHRGDSWFFINNMTALVLSRINPMKYRPYINKILEASTKEILYKGIIGYHAELSSAKAMKSEASLAQCWSSALYIELIRGIFK